MGWSTGNLTLIPNQNISEKNLPLPFLTLQFLTIFYCFVNFVGMGHPEKIVASIVLSFHFFEERLTGRRPFKTLIDFLSFDQGVASGVVAGRFPKKVELSCASNLWKIVPSSHCDFKKIVAKSHPRSYFSHPLNETMVDVGKFHIPLEPYNGCLIWTGDGITRKHCFLWTFQWIVPTKTIKNGPAWCSPKQC